MKWYDGLRHPGVLAALSAAILFGAGTPLAKQLLNTVSPWLLAGLLYLGSGIGLTLYRLITRPAAVSLPRNELLWFIGAILSGGIIAPVLLMVGLTGMPASGASLLLNAEGVFTALLAWFAFKENVDRRIALGMVIIIAGAVVLSWPEEVLNWWPKEAQFAGLWPTLAILGACFAWGIDNNLTRKVSLNDATWIAAVKGALPEWLIWRWPSPSEQHCPLWQISLAHCWLDFWLMVSVWRYLSLDYVTSVLPAPVPIFLLLRS